MWASEDWSTMTEPGSPRRRDAPDVETGTMSYGPRCCGLGEAPRAVEEVLDGIDVCGADPGRREWMDRESGSEDDEPATLQEGLFCRPSDCTVGIR